MKRKQPKELESLFGDNRLVPTTAFRRDLGKKLGIHRRVISGWTRWRIPVVATAVSATFIILLIPIIPLKSQQTILVSKLVESAYALEADNTGTFWRIDYQLRSGPKVSACIANMGEGISIDNDWGNNLHIKETTLFYKSSTTSAYLSTSAKYGISSSYSEDPDLPTFQSNYLEKLNPILDFNEGWVLTDATGKRLEKGATVPVKRAGVYDVYAVYQADMPNCKKRISHVTISAVTNILKSTKTYVNSIAPENLEEEYIQDVTITHGSFASVEDQFVALGFDKKRDNVYGQGLANVHVTNKDAGYAIIYNKAWLGRYQVKSIKNSSGEVVEYIYTFSAEPSFIYKIRTKAYVGTADYTSTADLARAASEKGWVVEVDLASNAVEIPGYGTISARTLQVKGNGKRMLSIDTGTPDIPNVYAEVRDSFDAGRDSTGSPRSQFWGMNMIRVFPPGTEQLYE